MGGPIGGPMGLEPNVGMAIAAAAAAAVAGGNGTPEWFM